jgi:hypothetical protein
MNRDFVTCNFVRLLLDCSAVFEPEDGDSKFLQIVSKILPDYTETYRIIVFGRVQRRKARNCKQTTITTTWWQYMTCSLVYVNQHAYIYIHSRMARWRNKNRYSHSGGICFEFWLWHQLYWLSFRGLPQSFQVVIFWIIIRYILRQSHAVAKVVEALCYKPEGRGSDSRWVHWIFQLK